MREKHLFPLCVAVVLGMCVSTPAVAQKNKKQQEPTNFIERPAIFEVTTDVVNKDVIPYTVTINSFGNTLMHIRNGAFEPKEWRDRFMAEMNADDAVYADIAMGGRMASGYLDGAKVQAFRIINGEMVCVRRDEVAEGGTVIEYWDYHNSQTVQPESTSYTYKWNDSTTAGTPVWFTVFAIDKAGNFSKAGDVVQLTRPDELSGNKPKNKTFSFREPRRADDDVPPAAPSGVEAEVLPGGEVRFSWQPVNDEDIQGYTIGWTTTNPAQHRGQYLKLAGKAASEQERIQEGDMVFVAKQFRDYDPTIFSALWRENKRLTKGFYPDLVSFKPDAKGGKSWRRVPHADGSTVEAGGLTYLELELSEGERVELGARDVGAASQDYFPVPQAEDYVIEVWLRASEADVAPVTFKLTGGGEVGEALPTLTFQPGTQWQKFSETVRAKVPENGKPGALTLVFEGEGTYSVDNFRVYRADTPYLYFLPEDVQRIKDSGLEFIRTHGPIKTGRDTYSMDMFTNPAGVISGIKYGNTLPQMLGAFEAAGVDPWLQIEKHMSADEWLGFAEYMCAPYDPSVDSPEAKPWAYKRYSQGREKPWVDAFDKIYFEISNETWNWLFQPWVFLQMTDNATGEQYGRGAVYGMFNDWVVENLRSSPFWTDAVEEKFDYVYCGWLRSNYGWEAVEHDKHGDVHTIANYIRGWDGGGYDMQVSDDSPGTYYAFLQNAYQATQFTAVKDMQQLVRLNGEVDGLVLGTYEAGPGYSFGNAQQSRMQEVVSKSKVGGTATLDNFLMLTRYGYDLQNFFTYDRGARWSSHAVIQKGGHPYPCFETLALFNNEGVGDMLNTVVESVSTVDAPEAGRAEETPSGPLADVYATRDGDRVNIFCISRELPDYPLKGNDGFTQFMVKLPFTSAEKVTLYRMTGDLKDHNVEDYNVRVVGEVIATEVQNIPALVINQHTGGDERGLGPSEMYLYVFEGTNIGPEGRIISAKEKLENWSRSFNPGDE